MDEALTRDTGRLGLAVGVVAAGSVVCLATYFAVGGPFGTINDVGNAATGVLSGWLAWRLRGELEGAGRNVAVGTAVAGAAITVAARQATTLRTVFVSGSSIAALRDQFADFGAMAFVQAPKSGPRSLLGFVPERRLSP